MSLKYTLPFIDNRGFFLNTFRAYDSVFSETWGNRSILQVNFSLTKKVGAIRGLHYQSHPYSEAKLVRCLKGHAWDLAVDLRPDSPTFGTWESCHLTPDLGNAFLIPEGCAHGFQVLSPSTELLYLHSGSWIPEADHGVHWRDPQLSIPWPMPPTELSDKDQRLPFLSQISSF